MSEQNIQEAVREKYGAAAKQVKVAKLRVAAAEHP
jgi:hypothetical protein